MRWLIPRLPLILSKTAEPLLSLSRGKSHNWPKTSKLLAIYIDKTIRNKWTISIILPCVIDNIKTPMITMAHQNHNISSGLHQDAAHSLNIRIWWNMSKTTTMILIIIIYKIYWSLSRLPLARLPQKVVRITGAASNWLPTTPA